MLKYTFPIPFRILYTIGMIAFFIVASSPLTSCRKEVENDTDTIHVLDRYYNTFATTEYINDSTLELVLTRGQCDSIFMHSGYRDLRNQDALRYRDGKMGCSMNQNELVSNINIDFNDAYTTVYSGDLYDIDVYVASSEEFNSDTMDKVSFARVTLHDTGLNYVQINTVVGLRFDDVGQGVGLRRKNYFWGQIGAFIKRKSTIQNVPSFTVNADTIYEGGTIKFTNTSSPTPTSVMWDFGDKIGTSTDLNPEYSYWEPGTFTVTMTAIFPDKSEKRTSQEIVVKSAPTSVEISKVEVRLFPTTNLTDTTDWDKGSGPDLYLDIMDMTTYESIQITSVKKDVDKNANSVIFNLSQKIVSSELGGGLVFHLYDEDVNNDGGAMDDWLGSLHANFGQPIGYPSNFTYTNSTEDLKIKVYFDWK